MTSFRTEFREWASPFAIDHADQILCLGSCFAHELHQGLSDLQFKTGFSPFGIAFNPLSLCDQLDRIIENKPNTTEDLILNDSLWHSLAHHGSYSAHDRDLALDKMNRDLGSAHFRLTQSRVIVMTWGSAHYYQYKKTGQVVANCHKIPQNNFEKKRASIEEITQSFEKIMNKLKELNPGCRIILSISPVRYLRDGFAENSRSKAILLESAWRLCEKLAYLHYFPSYEIFMDDLRDYRFCKSDLVHPNEEAIQYILHKFGQSFFTAETQAINQKIKQVLAKSAHRPLHPESSSHRDFLTKLNKEKQDLKAEYPYIDFNWD